MMRSLLLAALGITAFSATMAVETPEANAVVYCAAGVVRAGCVVRPGVASVRGVARRTTRRVVRRSDMMLKHDISLLGHLDNGLGFYRFETAPIEGAEGGFLGLALTQRKPFCFCHWVTSLLSGRCLVRLPLAWRRI